MSDTATELPQAETPPSEPEAQPQAQGDGDPAPLNVEDDAAVDAALEASVIPVPGDEGLVPTSQAGKIAGAYRGKIKELKAELASAQTTAAEATTLKQYIAQLQHQVQQLQPQSAAYQAMVQAAQQQAPEDTSEAEEYARLLDLYTPDGKPDVERGTKGLAIQRKLAEQAAQQHVAPIQQHTTAHASAHNLLRAKNTELPGGVKADPQMLEHVWRQLDPALTATPEGAKQALIVAMGYSQLTGQLSAPSAPARPRTPSGQFQAPTPPDPIFTEKAGGKSVDVVGGELSDADKKYCKANSISEKDFLESARKAPWLRR